MDRFDAHFRAPAGARCIAALFSRSRHWPRKRSRKPACARCSAGRENGPPRDPAAWLIFVGRNSALDDLRRRRKEQALPDEDVLSDLDDAETELAERLDSSHYRDDVLRLMFICCHPDLPATQQIALALRIVSGLTVKEIARAFLVGESAMEQRITRAKRRVAAADVPSIRPAPAERAARLAAVSAMIYLALQRRIFGERRHVSTCACRCARKRSASPACCCACSRAKWSHGTARC